VGLAVIYRYEYLLEEFLRNTSHRVEERCGYCYQVRLEAAAREANRGLTNSTTLLESTHQDHTLIRAGEVASETESFYYKDFRR
jgi:predicted adenine nucleotide alpha hydrolase (AANH) superfamily ATPase